MFNTNTAIETSVVGTPCSICLENFQRNETLTGHSVDKVSHLFHKKCLDTWFIYGGTCPICKQGIYTRAEEPLRGLPPVQGDDRDGAMEIIIHRVRSLIIRSIKEEITRRKNNLRMGAVVTVVLVLSWVLVCLINPYFLLLYTIVLSCMQCMICSYIIGQCRAIEDCETRLRQLLV